MTRPSCTPQKYIVLPFGKCTATRFSIYFIQHYVLHGTVYLKICALERINGNKVKASVKTINQNWQREVWMPFEKTQQNNVHILGKVPFKKNRTNRYFHENAGNGQATYFDVLLELAKMMGSRQHTKQTLPWSDAPCLFKCTKLKFWETAKTEWKCLEWILTSMVAVLTKPQPLPGAQVKLAVSDRDGHAASDQGRLNVGRL